MEIELKLLPSIDNTIIIKINNNINIGKYYNKYQ